MNEKTQQQIRTIILEVRGIYESYRSKNTWTTHQDFIGLGILLSCQALLIGLGYAWFIGFCPTWLAIVSIALITSILHELEHDLIHDLYFKRIPLLYHWMMLGVYIFRPISLNPWIRKHWHHFHHQHSGMPFDIEERGITNGDRLSLLRLLVLPDLLLSGILRIPRLRKEILIEYNKGNLSKNDMRLIIRTVLLGLLPFGVPLTILWYAFVGIHLFHWIGYPLPQFELLLQWIWPLMVLLVIPNLIRQFALHFVSSNMHYMGDVEAGNVIQQVQVFTPWWSTPLQWFCFFFGATHAIHHFVVNEPFYLRQLTRKAAQEVLIENGIRLNDVKSLRFSNRYHHTKNY
jgi:hypothetical protein